MKINARNKSSWKWIPLLSLLCIPTLTGCSQDRELYDENPHDSIGIDDNEPVGITVSVNGLEDYGNGADTRSGNESGEGMSGGTSVLQVDTIVENGLVVRRELIAESWDEVKTRATTRFTNAVFRAVAFKGSNIATGAYAGTALFKINDLGGVSLVAGSAQPESKNNWVLEEGVYSFAFYSYGTDETPPSINSSSSSISLKHGKNFLLGQRENVNVNYANTGGICNISDVVFSQQCVKINIDFTVSMYRDNFINECKVVFLGTPPSPQYFDTRNAQVGYTGNYADNYRKLATVDLDNTKTASVEMILLPWIHQAIGRIYVENLTFFFAENRYTNIPIYDNAQMFLKSRTNYRFKVEIIDRQDIYLDGRVWARSNLVRTADGRHRFANPGETGSFYAWNSLGTDANWGAWSEQRDPCRSVENYNKNTWVTPSMNDFSDFNNAALYEKTKGDTELLFTSRKDPKKTFSLPVGGYYVPTYDNGASDPADAYVWTQNTLNGKVLAFNSGTQPNLLEKNYRVQIRCIKIR